MLSSIIFHCFSELLLGFGSVQAGLDSALALSQNLAVFNSELLLGLGSVSNGA